MGSKFFDSTSSLLVLLGILVLVNILSDRFNTKFDITEDSLYSLSEGTRSILKKMDSETHIKYYLSESVESAPLGLKNYGKRIKELLEEYSYASGGRIKLEIIDPRPDTEEESWAAKDGIQQTPLPNGESFFMGAIVRPGNKAIPVFNPQREEFLEYDITQMILQSRTTGKQKLGILSGFDVVGTQFQFKIPGQPEPKKDWVFVKELKKIFDVINIETDTVELPDLNLLLVIHPSGLSEQTQYAIDQHVIGGGRTIILVDPASQVKDNTGPKKSSDLSRLFKKWGIQYQPDFLVADPMSSTRVNTQRGVIEYPVWLSLSAKAMSKENVSVANLESVMMIEAGSLDKIEGSTVAFSSLIQSSKEASVIPGAAVNQGDPSAIFRNLKPGNKPLTLAAIYTGKFQSSFSSPPQAPQPKEGETPAKPARSYSKVHVGQSISENSLLVVADTDFLLEKYSVRTFNFFGQSMATPLNDNLSLIQNFVEYMGGDQDLISIRSRGKFTRPFERVQKIQKLAQAKYKAKEKELSDQLKEVQGRINKLQSHRVEGNRVILSREQIREIEQFREKELAIKRERRLVRKNLREDIESLGQKLSFLNVLLVPLLVGLYGTYRVFSFSNKGGR
jgi:ABC-type uncharacterized transport system involved in gliding motility auxiliary subunit